ncbi:Phage-related protein [Anoxybacillus ayderensis]|uniref:Phage-related protein n=1 Tax=Anoxybacillus ayderensis TaxID=265546 RepID=A0A0D0HLU9_9BACL|nr:MULTISPECIES: distal tail protein Dit [Anoxybacillus]KIP21139.1 Phage-related protein [Anoxybacillus ayderensis]MCL9970346.1 phage tail family protein [Anoxybacillus kestanbolensis]
MSMWFQFDGIRSEELNIKVLRFRNPALPTFEDNYENVPGRHGSLVFPKEFGTREIEIDCLITHESREKRRQDIRKLSRIFTRQESKLILSEEPDVYYIGKLAGSFSIDVRKTLSSFTLVFRCQPFRYAIDTRELTFDMDSNSVQYISNHGTAETYPSFMIQAVFGEIQNPKITINDKYLLHNGVLTPNSAIEINTESFLATKSMERDIATTGAYDTAENNILSMIDGEFGAFFPGGNTFAYSSANGQRARIRLVWQERYL